MSYSQKLKLFPFIFVLCEISVYLSNDMYLPSMPTIAQDLALTQEQIQSTLTFWFLGASSLQILMGPISDRFGRKWVIIFGCALFVASSFVCAVTYSLPIMLFARFVQGTTICFIVVAGNAAIHEAFNTVEAIKWLALMGAITILAPALGPLLGAIIVQFASWRYIFWVLVVMGSISFVLLVALMPETNKNPHPFHIRKIAKGYLNIIRSRDFMLPSLGYCFLVGIFFLWMFESPFIIIEKLHKSTLFYGLTQTFIFSMFFIGAKVTKWWLKKYELYTLVRTAVATTIIGVLLFLVTSIFLNNIYIATACMMLISFGSSMLFGPINRISIEASKQSMGSRVAVFSTNISLAGALSGWIITVLDVADLYSLSVLVTVCTVIASLLILQTKIPRMGLSPS